MTILKNHQRAAPLTIQLMVLVFIYLASVAVLLCPVILGAELIWPRLTATEANDLKQKSCERIYDESICCHRGRKRVWQKICVQ